MALPATIDTTVPPDSQAPSLGDDRIREFKQYLVDVFGLPSTVTTAYFVGSATGITRINFKTTTPATDVGQMSRSVNTMRYGDGTHAQLLNGTVSWNATVVGNTGGGEDDLMSYTVPAAYFTSTNAARALEIIAAGTFANTAGNKTLKFKVGSGTSITLNGVTAGPQNKMWWAHFFVYSTATDSEFITGQFIIDPGSTEGPINGTAAEATASAIILKFTGESAGSTTNDVTQKFMLVRVVGGTGLT